MREQIVINTSAQRLTFKSLDPPCRIGKAGTAPMAEGREGDAKTPLGEYSLRFGLYRPDRLPSPNKYWPDSNLTFRAMREDDGWCDAPDDAAYNRFIRLPFPASHEKLWRDDGAYDVVLVMSHNDSPPKTDENGVGLGSAVFIHIAQFDDRKTMGCVALAPEDMVRLLPHLQTGMGVKII